MLTTCRPSRSRPHRRRARLRAPAVGVMRLRRRLRNERDPDNELSSAQMVVLGLLVPRSASMTVGELAAPSGCSRRR